MGYQRRVHGARLWFFPPKWQHVQHGLFSLNCGLQMDNSIVLAYLSTRESSMLGLQHTWGGHGSILKCPMESLLGLEESPTYWFWCCCWVGLCDSQRAFHSTTTRSPLGFRLDRSMTIDHLKNERKKHENMGSDGQIYCKQL